MARDPRRLPGINNLPDALLFSILSRVSRPEGGFTHSLVSRKWRDAAAQCQAFVRVRHGARLPALDLVAQLSAFPLMSSLELSVTSVFALCPLSLRILLEFLGCQHPLLLSLSFCKEEGSCFEEASGEYKEGVLDEFFRQCQHLRSLALPHTGVSPFRVELSLPDSITLLTDLRSLDSPYLSHLPDWITDLRSLRNLSVHSFQDPEDPVPTTPASFSSLSLLTSLQVKGFTGLAESVFEELPQGLRKLGFSGGQWELHGPPQWLWTLRHLESLDLEESFPMPDSLLQHLQCLTSLALSGETPGAQGLLLLPSLVSLNLSLPPHDVNFLSSFSLLRELTVFSLRSLEALPQGMTQLRRLALFHIRRRPRKSSQCLLPLPRLAELVPGLQVLEVIHTDEGMSVDEMKHLQSLVVVGTALIEGLKSLTSLSHMRLSGDLSGSQHEREVVPCAVRRLHGLRTLKVEIEKGVSARAWGRVAVLRGLQSLSLSAKGGGALALPNRFFTRMGRLKHLQLLLGSGEATNGALPDSLTCLTSLQTLSLRRREPRCRDAHGDISLQLPQDLGALTHLRELRIIGNLHCLPQSIGGLVSLEVLQLERSKLPSYLLQRTVAGGKELEQVLVLHESVGLLPSLRCVMLKSAAVHVPDSLWQLASLKELFVHALRLTPGAPDLEEDTDTDQESTLPQTATQLPALCTLRVVVQDLGSFPRDLGSSRHLRFLQVEAFNLSELPDGLGDLDRLEVLHVASDKLASLPGSMGRLIRLRELKLSCRAVSALPQPLGQLRIHRLELVHMSRVCALPLHSAGGAMQVHLLVIHEHGVEIRLISSPTLAGVKRLSVLAPALQSFPEDLSGMGRLEELTMDGSDVTSLTSFINPFPLPELFPGSLKKVLLKRCNYIASVPLGLASQLVSLVIEDCPQLEDCAREISRLNLDAKVRVLESG